MEPGCHRLTGLARSSRGKVRSPKVEAAGPESVLQSRGSCLRKRELKQELQYFSLIFSFDFLDSSAVAFISRFKACQEFRSVG